MWNEPEDQKEVRQKNTSHTSGQHGQTNPQVPVPRSSSQVPLALASS